MMMFGDPKKIVTSIIAGKVEAAPRKDGAEYSDFALKSIGESIISAVKSGEVSALVASLKSFIKICEEMEESKPENPYEDMRQL